jgi:hypothetical protein
MRIAVVLTLLILALCAANAGSVAAPRSEILLPPTSSGA